MTLSVLICGNNVYSRTENVGDNDLTDLNGSINGDLVDLLHAVEYHGLGNRPARFNGNNGMFAADDLNGGMYGAGRIYYFGPAVSVAALAGVALYGKYFRAFVFNGYGTAEGAAYAYHIFCHCLFLHSYNYRAVFVHLCENSSGDNNVFHFAGGKLNFLL